MTDASDDTLRRILIADDDPFIIALYQAKLRRAGFLVETVADGEEAIRRVEQNPPDLILLDLNMPRVNGLQVLRHLRAQPRFQRLPVVVLSNACTEEVLKEVWDAHPTQLLTKRESTPNAVVNEILHILNETPAARAAPSPAPAAGPVPPPAPIPLRPGPASGVPSFDGRIASDLLRALAGATTADTQREHLLSLYQMVQPRLRASRGQPAHRPDVIFAEAAESLFEDLYARPEYVTSSTLRTLDQAVQRLSERPSPDAETAPRLVLLLSREDLRRDAMARALERPLWRLLRLADPSAALALFDENRLDAIVMDGLRETEDDLVAGRARSSAQNAATPIVWVVPANAFEARRALLPGPGHDMIARPWTAPELLLKVLCAVGPGATAAGGPSSNP